MPNWVYNSLTIEGPKEDIDKLKQQVGAPFSEVHDNWNAETKTMEVREYKYSNPVFAFHNIYNHTQAGISNEEYVKQPDHKLGEPIRFDGNHWYDFNVREWGTKWDVAVSDENKYPDTEITMEGKDTLGYLFNTAWSPPIQAIEKLSSQYPTLLFTLSFEEEQGWGGEIEFVSGEQTTLSEYGWKCRECDNEEEEQPYCEECDFDTCPSCGYNESDEPCEEHKEGHNAHLLT